MTADADAGPGVGEGAALSCFKDASFWLGSTSSKVASEGGTDEALLDSVSKTSDLLLAFLAPRFLGVVPSGMQKRFFGKENTINLLDGRWQRMQIFVC